MCRDVARAIEASVELARIGKKEATMFIVRITAILALVYFLSLTAAGDDGRGIDPNGGRATSTPSYASGDRGAGLDPNG